ncbi:MAG: zinc dependent phospholipase C family protein [Bacilli bacterium]|nr:zinc dependent phospholipase C family protein [Bacilli bacterium]
MPATMTHAYFAIDVFNKLDGNSKMAIKNNLLQYKMFSQSTDPLMFYNIETLKPGKSIRSFQYTFHATKSQLFFCSLVDNIKRYNLENDPSVLAYLYGMICHYVLDSNVHPFVFYKTGKFVKTDKSTYKYNNVHSFMETFIDIEMMKRNGINSPYGFRIDNFTFDLGEFNEGLNLIIDSTFSYVFGINNMSTIYYTSLVHMKRFLKRYMIDDTGIKRMLYKMIDKCLPKYIFRFEALSYHYKCRYGDFFLNSKRDIWYNPVDPSICSYDSFDDLYNKSIQEAVFIINSVDAYLHGKNINLKLIFKNKSYISGLDCNIGLNFKKFAF